MTVTSSESSVPAPVQLAIGGLQFEASFRGAGATLRVFGDVDGQRTELLRFDDFIETPHYHVPAHGDPIEFDRVGLGDPLEWFVGQLRDHLPELLTDAGYAGILPGVDAGAVSAGADRIREAMISCVPAGYVRVKGVGLQRAGAS